MENERNTESPQQASVPVKPRQRKPRKMSTANSHNPLGKQVRTKPEEEGGEAPEGDKLVNLLVAALKSVVESNGGSASAEEVEKDSRRKEEEEKAEESPRQKPAVAGEGLARAVAKPLTSEEVRSEPEETFWGNARNRFAELELQYPFKVWGTVGLLVVCLVVGMAFVSMALFELQFEKPETVVAKESTSPVAPPETTLEAITILLRGDGEEARKFLVSHEPPVPGAAYLEAIAEYRAGNLLQAKATLEKAPQNSTRSTEQAFLAWTSMVGKSSTFSLSGQSSEEGTLGHIRASLEADAVNTFAWRLLALWQRRNNKPEAAIHTLEAARLLADADGQRAEVEIQLAIARVGAVATQEEARALKQPLVGVARIAARAASEALWGKREKAISELSRLAALMGMSSTMTFLADPVFQSLALTDIERATLGRSAEEVADGK